MARQLSLPVIAIMVAEPVPICRDLRSMMAPPYKQRRLQMQRAMRDQLRAWNVPALLFTHADPVVVLDVYTRRQSPHVVIADEFVSHRSRLQFDTISRSWPFSVFTFNSDVACPGLFTLDSQAEFDADAVRRRFEQDCDQILLKMTPLKVADDDVQATLFVEGTRRVYLDADLIKQLKMPDRTPPGPMPTLTLAERFELGLTSPFRAADLIDEHIQRQKAIWLATRSPSVPSLTATGQLSIGYQQLAKGITKNAEFDTLQHRLRTNRFLEPDQRRRWARLLVELVGEQSTALAWACTLLESYTACIRRPIVEFQLYLDMIAD